MEWKTLLSYFSTPLTSKHKNLHDWAKTLEDFHSSLPRVISYVAPCLFTLAVFCRACLFTQLPEKEYNMSWRGCWRGLCLALLWVAPSWQSWIFTALFRTRMWCCGAWSHMSTWYHLSSLVNFIWRTVLTGRITGGFPPPLILWHTTILKLVVPSIYGPPWEPHQRGIFPWARAVPYKSYPR